MNQPEVTFISLNDSRFYESQSYEEWENYEDFWDICWITGYIFNLINSI